MRNRDFLIDSKRVVAVECHHNELVDEVYDCSDVREDIYTTPRFSTPKLKQRSGMYLNMYNNTTKYYTHEEWEDVKSTYYVSKVYIKSDTGMIITCTFDNEDTEAATEAVVNSVYKDIRLCMANGGIIDTSEY